MPLLKFDLIKGRDELAVKKLLDVTHRVLVAALDIPLRDRYQCVTQHSPGELILQDTGLGYARSHKVVLLTVISRPRDSQKKQQFYRQLARSLHEECGLSEDDLMVSFIENSDADWSFGRGNAEFLSGALG